LCNRELISTWKKQVRSQKHQCIITNRLLMFFFAFSLSLFVVFSPPSSFSFFLFFHFTLYCCFSSKEARWPIRDGDRVGRGRQSEGWTAETARKRPKRPWTAARTMEVLRRCSLAIAQRLVHCAIAVSTAVLGQSQRQ